jgi:hypothetical protein
VHPYITLPPETQLGGYFQNFANVTAAHYLGFDYSGTLRFRSRFASSSTGGLPIKATVSEVREIKTNLGRQSYNKIVVSADLIKKSTAQTMVWNMLGSGMWEYSHDQPSVLVSSGDYFPSLEYGEFVAKWGAVEK